VWAMWVGGCVLSAGEGNRDACARVGNRWSIRLWTGRITSSTCSRQSSAKMSARLRARRRAHKQVAVPAAADDYCRVRPAGEPPQAKDAMSAAPLAPIRRIAASSVDTTPPLLTHILASSKDYWYHTSIS
jgi:hypothetical protein